MLKVVPVLFFLCVCGAWHWGSQKVDYSNLERLLAHGKWMEADKETSIIIGRVLRKEVDAKTFFGYSRLDILGIRKNKIINSIGLPCEDLQHIDLLWLKYSKGNFGFTAQSQISLPMEALFSQSNERQKTISRFEKDLGWRDSSGYIIPRNKAWYRRAEAFEQIKGFLPSDLWVRENAPEPPRHHLVDTLRHFRICTKLPVR
jgi:GUN4-like